MRLSGILPYGQIVFELENNLNMQDLHSVTPVWESYFPAKNRVFYKMEALQPSGSFKIRGIGRLCVHAVQNGATRIVASSGGNAGLAAAYAGKTLGVPVAVFVPATTGESMRERLRKLDAVVTEHGNVWDETHAYAEKHAESHNAAYVHPFEHPMIWEGHATIIDELQDIGFKPKNIVVSVGGGGLLLGLLHGLAKVGWNDVNVFSVETEGTASLYESIKAKNLITLPAIAGIATSLGARTVAAEAFKQSMAYNVRPVVVSDQEALAGVLQFANEKRVLVEPACGAALAVTYSKQEILPDGDTLVIVCGGSNVTLEQLESWKQMTQTNSRYVSATVMEIEKISQDLICGSDALSAENLERLISGEVTALCVPNYYDVDILGDIYSRIQESGMCASYAYTSVISKIGIAWQEVLKGSQAEKLAYFSRAQEHFASIRKVFGGISPLDKFRLDADEMWPQGANIMRYQGHLMFAGVVRVFEEGSYALPHQDDLTDLGIQLQIGMNVYIQPAQDGGKLELWDLTLSPSEYESMRLHARYGLDRQKLSQPDSVLIPEAGDLIVFDTCKVHAVSEITSGVRISQGAFIGYKKGESLRFWS
jgi:L-serine/L-threonine ammonia-lyase